MQLVHLCRYGYPAIVNSLSKVCEYNSSAPKIQEADWLGKVAIAARDGKVGKQTIEQLLQHPEAFKRLKKLQTQQVRKYSSLSSITFGHFTLTGCCST